MSKPTQNTEFATLAAFTVCADGDLANLASQVPVYVPGIEYAGEFQEYITAKRRPHFPQSMRDVLSCVALIDFDRDLEAAIETAEILQRTSSPRVLSVGISSQMDADLLLRAMRAGCTEFLHKPVDVGQLQQTLQRLQNRLTSSMATTTARGRVLSFFGAKGGVGTTTLAVHLAAYLVKRHGKKTLLIDHHHQLGHVCLYLGLKESHYHFDDLIRNVERLDSDLLNGFLVRHVSGLAVLASPDTCSVRHRCTREEIERVFDFLRHDYDYILVDSSMQYEEITAATIDFSDEVYLVSTPDVAALRDLSRHVENLSLSEVAASRLRIVINRSSSHDDVNAEQIEKAVRFPVSLSISNNYAELLQAINAGEPISPQRRSDFTMQISKWANQVVSGEDRGKPVNGTAAKKKFAFWK